jgi:long-chain acyl-CoA synthetase
MAGVKQSGTVKESLFQTAYAAKQEGLKEGKAVLQLWFDFIGYLTHAVWDPLVFSTVREKLGGNVRLMVTGSAPLSTTVMEFLRICFSCPVVEG